jgi:hypothetical protein
MAFTQPSMSDTPASDMAQSGSERRFDLRALLLIAGAALLGAGWALYNRTIAPSAPDQDAQLHALVWVIFATPFATFWGWFFARPGERRLAAAVCFCIYFCSIFVAARYESCAVVWSQYGPAGCFSATAEARQAAAATKHQVYFQAIVVIQVLVALAVALRRALTRSTIAISLPRPEEESS